MLGLGAGAVVVTRGADGVLVAAADGGAPTWLDAVPVPLVVDQTGAGDALAGTLAARLAAGDPLLEAARLGTAAAALSLAGAGGTGRVPTLVETRRPWRPARAPPEPARRSARGAEQLRHGTRRGRRPRTDLVGGEALAGR